MEGLASFGLTIIDFICLFLKEYKELFIALLGALVGGFFTFAAATKSHRLEVKAKRENDIKSLRNTLSLIRAELTVAWRIYEEEFSSDLMNLNYGQPYLTFFPVGSNPFPIYDSAPASLAELPRELSETIVYFYVRAKGLIEMINTNNNAYKEASNYARDALVKKQAQLLAAHSDGFDAVEFYSARQYQMGLLLNMGSITESLKSITAELEQNLTLLKASIDEFNGREVS